MATNVAKAYAVLNGQKVNATYDEATGLWSVEMTAPAESSWSQPDHVFGVTLYAEDEAGNEATLGPSDTTYGDQLKIRVLETTKPTARITYPTPDAVLGSATQVIVLEVFDEGGSGLNMTSVVFKLNGEPVDITGIFWEETQGVKTASYTAENLSDGVNTVELFITDNDGNRSETAKVQFIISTVAPLLTVLTPFDGLVTNAASVDVTGEAAPGSESVSLTEVTVNGVSVELGEPDEDGYKAFSHEVQLMAGENSITVVAKDSLGKTTSVTRTITYDAEAPVISDVVTEATTVNASSMIKITFKVVDR